MGEMKKEYDFSKGKRGAIDPAPAGLRKKTLQIDVFNPRVGLGRLCNFNCGGNDGNANWCALTGDEAPDCRACKIIQVDFWEGIQGK